MSWDIYVQQLPPGIRSADAIPDHFVPGPVGRRQRIIELIRRIVPEFAVDDSGFGLLEGDEFKIEIDLGGEEQVDGFAFHVYGGEMAPFVVGEILKQLDLRALDPSSDSGLFAMPESRDGYQRWISYRERQLKF